MGDRKDTYRQVTFMLRSIRPNSFIISRPRSIETFVLPRSLIHGADELRLCCLRNELLPLDGCVARVFAWKAEELGLHA